MVDPITIIVTALASGAAAGLKPTAKQAIRDAYAGLKSLIQRKLGTIASVDALESKPESETKRKSVAEDLADAGAGNNVELLDQAKALLDVLKEQEPTTVAAMGVDLKGIEAAYLKIKKVAATGTGISVEKAKFEGGIDIEDVTAGRGGDTPKKP